jgi:uncharacterized protein YjbI with pentapeptide repeats
VQMTATESLVSRHPDCFSSTTWAMDLTKQEVTADDARHLREIIPTLAPQQNGNLLCMHNAKLQCDFDLSALKLGGRVSFFGATFERTADFSKTIFASRADFRSVVFAGHTRFSATEFEELCIFSSAKFSGSSSFTGAKFSSRARLNSITFNSEAHFNDCEFGSSLEMTKCNFKSAVDFSGSVYRSNASIRESVFGGAVSFRRSRFEAGCDVSNNKFSRRVPFGESTFGGPVSLSNSVFAEIIHLDQCRFSSHIDFYGTQFMQRLDMQKSQLQTPLVISAASISLADTRLENGGHLIITEGVNLTRTSVGGRALIISPPPGWEPSKIDAESRPKIKSMAGASIVSSLVVDPGVVLDGSISHVAGLDRLVVSSESIPASADGTFSFASRLRLRDEFQVEAKALTSAQLRELYRSIRVGSEQAGDSQSSNDFYYSEMVMRRRAAWEKGRFDVWFILALYGTISGFGLKVIRPLCGLVALVLIASTVAWRSGPFNPECLGSPPACPNLSLSESVQYMARAAVSFSQEPGNNLEYWEQWLQLLVRFSGPALLALAILGIRSKVRR